MNILNYEFSDHIRSILNYDNATGVFTWKEKPTSKVSIGDVAGCVNAHGYRVITINKKQYREHRLAWLYVYGYTPKKLDHINRNKTDNRVSNLRPISTQGNARNQGLNPRNKSGFNGVLWCKLSSKWRAQIVVSGKAISIGFFSCFVDACWARYGYNIMHGFHPTHGFKLTSDDLL
tara:strand:+ start:2256 stop:2783 length:528 start_codon:yes stop_codon:yes gene_type:complete